MSRSRRRGPQLPEEVAGTELGAAILAASEKKTAVDHDFMVKHHRGLSYEGRSWYNLRYSWFARDHEKPKAVQTEGSHRVSTYPVFMREAYSRLFSGDRMRQKKEVAPEAQYADRLHSCLNDLPEWQRLTKRCAGDAYNAGLATVSMGQKMIEHIPVHNHDADDLRKLVELLEEDEERGELKDPQELANARTQLEAAEKEAQRNAGQIDDTALRQTMREAVAAVGEQLDEVDSAARALGWGIGSGGGGQGGDLATKAKVAEKILGSNKLREIMRLAGRMKSIMADVQATKVRHGVSEITDVEMGGDYARLILSELGQLTHPKLRLLVIRRILERGALQYHLEAREKVGRGPIVICIDDSGSMGGAREMWAKSLALALLELARREKRDYAYCTFDTGLQQKITDSSSKRLGPMELLNTLAHHSGGGTNFDAPLSWALDQIEKGGLPDADVIFISDGACMLLDRPKLLARIHRLGCKVIGVGIGAGQGAAQSLEAFADPAFPLEAIAVEGDDSSGTERRVLKTVLGL